MRGWMIVLGLGSGLGAVETIPSETVSNDMFGPGWGGMSPSLGVGYEQEMMATARVGLIWGYAEPSCHFYESWGLHPSVTVGWRGIETGIGLAYAFTPLVGVSAQWVHLHAWKDGRHLVCGQEYHGVRLSGSLALSRTSIAFLRENGGDDAFTSIGMEIGF